MPRNAYIVEIEAAHIGALGYLAGLLTGQGIPQAQLLGDLLNRIQLVEVPDDFGPEQPPEEEESEQETWEGEGGALIDFPTPETSEELDSELPHIDPTTDPTAPENLGIALNLPAPPPPPVQTFGNQEDFGAGPPPREG